MRCHLLTDCGKFRRCVGRIATLYAKLYGSYFVSCDVIGNFCLRVYALLTLIVYHQ